MIDFLKAIIKPSYWFTHQNAVPDTWLYGLVFFFGGIVLIGVIFTVLANIKKFQKPYRNAFFKFALWGWTNGIFGFVLLFFSVERVWMMSARVFYLFWLALALYWLQFPIKYLKKDVPRLLAAVQERVEKEKYLPKRKK